MRWITGATVPLALAIFALGCTDEPVGPSDGSPAAPESTAAVDVSPLSNFLNGPESPGNSPVSRFASHRSARGAARPDPPREPSPEI